MTFGGEGTMGWTPSQQTRKKISEANSGKRAWNKGIPNPLTSERNISRRGEKRPHQLKKYKCTDPHGQQYIVTTGLLDFCKQHDLTPSNMCSVAKGKLKHHKKWHCEYI